MKSTRDLIWQLQTPGTPKPGELPPQPPGRPPKPIEEPPNRPHRPPGPIDDPPKSPEQPAKPEWVAVANG